MSSSILEKKYSLKFNTPRASIDFSLMLNEYINTYYVHPYKELIILCIGTDRSTGDSLGPIIGHKLSNSFSRYSDVHVYGTLDKPVHAKNLQENIAFIYKSFEKPFVIAIDACLGRLDRVGYITIGKGPLNPGAGVNKKLPSIGDLSITGIVNLSGYMEYIVLQSTRLSLVMNMADVLVRSINYSLWKLDKRKLSM